MDARKTNPTPKLKGPQAGKLIKAAHLAYGNQSADEFFEASMREAERLDKLERSRSEQVRME